MGGNVDELQKYKDAMNLAHFHNQGLISLHRNAPVMPRVWIEGQVNAACTVIVSKSVHDPVYGHVLYEDMDRLSRGNTEEKAFAAALAKTLALAGAEDPDTIERIPSEYQGYEIEAISARIGYNCSSLTEPLSSFVFGLTPSSVSPSVFTASMAQNKNVDIEAQMPINEAGTPKKARFSTEANLAAAAISGSTFAVMLASGAEDSPALRAFAVTAGAGFLCSFLAAYTAGKPKVSGFLSKVGVIGTASAVTIALGNTIRINFCLINVGVVIFGT